MKVSAFFLTTAAVLSIGASSVLAQGLSPGYVSPSLRYAANASVETYPSADSYYASNADLEARITQLEQSISKKADKPDTSKAFDVRLNGRVFFESITFGDPQVKYGDFGGQSDILGAREVHIGIAGTGYSILDYSVEIGYTAGNTEFRDVVLGVKNVPGLDYVRVGHYKLETGMGYVTSGLNSTAMETTTATQVFSPGRRFGIGQTYYFADEKVRWFNGLFASEGVTGTKFITDSDGVVYNSRLTFVPYYARDGARYFHFGGHYMYRDNPNGNNADFNATNARIGGFNRAGAWFTPVALNASYYNQGGLEAAWGCGPLAMSSEFFAGSFGNGRDMYGGHIEVRYFLTGDTRPYNKRNGVQGGVRLKENFLTAEGLIQTCHHGLAKGFCIKSWGAWEVYTQWGFTDSDRVARGDARIVENVSGAYHSGGRTTDLVLGLNWYWNPTTRVMFEYVRSDGTAKRSEYVVTDGVGATVNRGYRATEDIFAAGLRFNF